MLTRRFLRHFTALIFPLFALGPLAAQRPRPMPRLECNRDRCQLIVDGHPFLMLAGQAHNSSATSAEDLAPVWKSLVAMHANTAEVPIYWELIEPQPGHFDFHWVDEILAGARSNGLRLVLLWFASWKNGEMHYAPEWVKRDRARFQRVNGPRGEELEILSPLCEAARDADARAFAAVMEHLAKVDAVDRTVLMMQVENETGLLGTDRDYSEEATRLFRGAVPADLMAYLAGHRGSLSPSLKRAWQANGAPAGGTWSEAFGELAPEAFSAWHVARYVDAVAAAGKRAYSLPMYANDWLINPGNDRPGEWPSGGPTRHVLDIWKAAAPHLDLLAPDIYLPDFLGTCEDYTRSDNPLFVPETRFATHNAAFAFLTFARFNGLGFSPFGIDYAVENGKLSPAAAELEDTYRVLQPMLPLIASNQFTGKLHAIVQTEDWAQVIRVGESLAAVVHFAKPYAPDGPLGRGMLVELSPEDFVMAGAGFNVVLRELIGPPRQAGILSLEEGTFDGDRWVTTRRLNGDELHLSFPDKARILRVRLAR